MKQSTSYKGLLGAGMFSAVAASLCCITPVLVMIAGVSGAAASFSWIEPARPYLIGITILVLGFAWWQKIKPLKTGQIDCDCEEDKKPSFWQTKTFLAIVTLFAGMMLAFPYYSHIFFSNTKSKVVIIKSDNITTANFDIQGMTCQGCEEEVAYKISRLPGYIGASVDYKTGKATVKFNKLKSTLEDFETAINNTGYKVKHKDLIQKKSK